LFLFRLRNLLNFQVPNFELKPNCTPLASPHSIASSQC
jgi:hypothetical protein